MTRLSFLILALSLWLGACGSVPPAPVDRFYRLLPVMVPASGKALPVTLQPFLGESLYAERPVVYAQTANPRQLRQYHYHLWLYPPARIIQENLVASMGGAILDFSGREKAVAALEGRVIAFERVTDGASSRAVATLELHLVAEGKVLAGRRYQAEQRAGDESMDSFVAAMEQALARIYAEFLEDVRQWR